MNQPMNTDHDLTAALTAIARSAPPVPDGRARVLARVAQKRRRRRAGVAIAAVASVVLGGGLWSTLDTSDGPEPASPTTVPHEATVLGHAGLIGVVMKVEYPERRFLVRADVLLQGRSHRGEFSPDEPPGDGRPSLRTTVPGPVEVRAHAEMTVGGGAMANCAEPPGVPVLTVTSRVADGPLLRSRYTPADPAAYRTAFDRVCRAGLQAMPTEITRKRDGRFTAELRLANPGPDPVTVTSEEYAQGGVHWEPASITLPAGREMFLTIRATGDACTPQTPWATGHLRADGRPLKVTGKQPVC